MLKKVIKLNLEDLWLYIGVEGGLFLLFEVVVCGVMYFVRPRDGVTVSCVILPIAAGFLALIAGISHVGFCFEQALRCGQTRRRALGLTLGLAGFQTAFALALAGVLVALERYVCPPLWAALAGADSWAVGNIMPSPAGILVDGQPVQGGVLMIDTFTLDWWWWPVIFAAALAGGITVGALIQRFGSKGGWVVWCALVLPSVLTQLLPKGLRLDFQLVAAALGLLLAAAFVWSVWSLLHAVVRA